MDMHHLKLAAIIAAGNALAELMEDAESVHIYDFDNGDEQPDDCAYKVAREAWQAALAASEFEPPRLVIEIKGGMVQEVYGHAIPGGLSVMILDRDEQDGDDSAVTLRRAPKAPHTVAPGPLTLRGAFEELDVVELTAPPTEELPADDSDVIEAAPGSENWPSYNASFAYADAEGEPRTWAMGFKSPDWDAGHDYAMGEFKRLHPDASKIDMTMREGELKA